MLIKVFSCVRHLELHACVLPLQKHNKNNLETRHAAILIQNDLGSIQRRSRSLSLSIKSGSKLWVLSFYAEIGNHGSVFIRCTLLSSSSGWQLANKPYEWMSIDFSITAQLLAWKIREQCTRDPKTPKYEEQYVILAAVTYFTLCSIKSWCAAAIESVHSVCAGPVVLTGMICAIIDICFKGIGQKDNNGHIR